MSGRLSEKGLVNRVQWETLKSAAQQAAFHWPWRSLPSQSWHTVSDSMVPWRSVLYQSLNFDLRLIKYSIYFEFAMNYLPPVSCAEG